jgi:hypothetical protein
MATRHVLRCPRRQGGHTHCARITSNTHMGSQSSGCKAVCIQCPLLLAQQGICNRGTHPTKRERWHMYPPPPPLPLQHTLFPITGCGHVIEAKAGPSVANDKAGEEGTHNTPAHTPTHTSACACHRPFLPQMAHPPIHPSTPPPCVRPSCHTKTHAQWRHTPHPLTTMTCFTLAAHLRSQLQANSLLELRILSFSCTGWHAGWLARDCCSGHVQVLLHSVDCNGPWHTFAHVHHLWSTPP